MNQCFEGVNLFTETLQKCVKSFLCDTPSTHSHPWSSISPRKADEFIWILWSMVSMSVISEQSFSREACTPLTHIHEMMAFIFRRQCIVPWHSPVLVNCSLRCLVSPFLNDSLESNSDIYILKPSYWGKIRFSKMHFIVNVSELFNIKSCVIRICETRVQKLVHLCWLPGSTHVFFFQPHSF